MDVVFLVLEPLIFNFLWIHVSEFWIYLILCGQKTCGFFDAQLEVMLIEVGRPQMSSLEDNL